MTETTEQTLRPSLLRMIGVWFYDALLLFSAWMVAAAIAVAFNGGEAIGGGNPFLLLYFLAVSYLFFGWFWTHGGQTLGMRAWQVYLISGSHNSLNWQQAFMRFAVALFAWLPLGLGHLWQWLSPDKLSWQDIASGSQLVLVKKDKN